MEVEETLVERAKEDPLAFGLLYEKYIDRIYNYIFHRTSNVLEAEDLTSRTFYQALQNIQNYTDRGVPFSAWLYRIAHNLVANWHRDRSRRQITSLEDLAVVSKSKTSPDHLAEQNDKERALWEAIGRLHPDRQELLILKFSEGLSNAEIGQIMGRSEGAIKSLYHRTLLALRQDLEERGFLYEQSSDW
jgi:RNA polymerase sigma-70 factor (ECF subfamily)